MAKRILIADDSLTIQRAFAMSFAGEDLMLVSARSADEGLMMARQSRPELVIADGVMPGRSGYELCAAIKADPTLRGVPVYILTSSHNPYDEARGRQSGADGQLTKPFEAAALVERVGEAIAKGASVPLTVAPPARLASAPLAAAASLPVTTLTPAHAAPPAPETGWRDSDDDYGEITVEADLPAPEPVRAPQPTPPFPPAAPAAAPVAPPLAASEITPPPRAPLAPAPAAPPPRPATPGFTSTPSSMPGGLRPSLIPGLRPGAVAATRPGASPAARPMGLPGSTGHFSAPGIAPPASPSPSGAPASGSPPPRAPAPTMAPGPARTLVGLPASAVQPPARVGMTSLGARPAQPLWPVDTRTPPPVAVAPPSAAPVAAPVPAPPPAASAPPSIGAAAAATILSKVDQKVAAIAAKGPEYEAIAKLSREIIEKIVWEVVPELAELIVREDLQKRGRI